MQAGGGRGEEKKERGAGSGPCSESDSLNAVFKGREIGCNPPMLPGCVVCLLLLFGVSEQIPPPPTV